MGQPVIRDVSGRVENIIRGEKWETTCKGGGRWKAFQILMKGRRNQKWKLKRYYPCCLYGSRRDTGNKLRVCVWNEGRTKMEWVCRLGGKKSNIGEKK